MRARDAIRGAHARGAAAVELALVLPFILLLVFGVIEWGHYFFVETTVVNAAREGARAGSVAPIDVAEERAKDAVRTAVTGGSLDAARAVPVVSVTADSIVVSVTYPADTLSGVEFIPLPAQAFGRAEMRRY